MHRVRWLIAAAAAFVLPSYAACAQCMEDTRSVTVGEITQLTSFRCATGPAPNDPKVRVEFHRLSTVASSMAIGKTPPSSGFKATIGSAKVIENEVFKTYAGLVDQFGASNALGGSDVGLTLRTRVSGNNEARTAEMLPAEDRITGRRLRSIYPGSWGNVEYPNPEDVLALRRKKFPAGMKYYYAAECDDIDFSNPNADFNAPCKKSTKFTMHFWRGMRAGDANDFQKNLNAYNRLLRAGKPDANGSGFRHGITPIAERYLKFIKHIAGESWPEDLLILTGQYREDGCGGLPGLYGWLFEFLPRPVELHAILIKNESTRSISLDGMFGSTGPGGLRVSQSDLVTTSQEPLSWKSINLPAGQSVLIPTQIILASPQRPTEAEKKESDEVFARIGANGFDGSSANFKIIDVPDYSYGPRTAVGAISIGGKRIELRRQAVNFLDMTASLEAGSCPFLLAWDADERDWINYGKVLHKAPALEHEYTDVRAVPGFTARFRLEERESEIAFIDHAEASLVLRSGTVVTISPNNNVALTARDGDYLQLYWGDAVELEFALPPGVEPGEVLETRLSLTGYYRRYSALMAEGNLQQPARWPAMRRTALPSMSASLGPTTMDGPVCSR